jgi:WD40 repeat protein
MLTGDRDGQVRVWDLRRLTTVGAPISTYSPNVASLAVTPDGSRVIAAGQGVLGVWDLTSRAPVGGPLAVGAPIGVQGIPFSVHAVVTPDGTRIVTGSGDGWVRTYELDTRRQVGRPVRAHQLVHRVAVTPDAHTLITSGSDEGIDGTLRLWDLDSGDPVSEPIPAHHGFAELAVTPDGGRVVSAGSDGRVRVWRTDGTCLPIGGPVPAHSGWISAVAVTPDGTRVVTAGRDALHVWPLTEPSPTGTVITAACRDIGSLALTPDGRRMVCGGVMTGTLQLWAVP